MSDRDRPRLMAQQWQEVRDEAMNPAVATALRRILADRGLSLVNDPRRIEAMLRDLCPEDRAEVNLLVMAQQDGVPGRLLHAAESGSLPVTTQHLIAQLTRDRGLRPSMARWAVTTWGSALDLAMLAVPQDGGPDDSGPSGLASPTTTTAEIGPTGASELVTPTGSTGGTVITGPTAPPPTGPTGPTGGVDDGESRPPDRQRAAWLAWVTAIASIAALVFTGMVLIVFVTDMWKPGGWTRFWSVVIAVVPVVLWLGGAGVVAQAKGTAWGWFVALLGIVGFPAYTFLASRGGRARNGEPLSSVPMTALMVLWTLIAILPYNLAW